MAANEVARFKKKANRCRGEVLFADEASFWLDGTLHQTWARVGQQPRVDTYGQRKTAHVFAAVSLHKAEFAYRFADKFNNRSFLAFLKQLVNRFGGRKIFLIVDNAPHHNLSADGKKWLRDNSLAIEIHRLPPYSPEFMPVEGIWKKTRKLTTHNTFYTTVNERDTALRKTFTRFQRKPETLDSMVARFR